MFLIFWLYETIQIFFFRFFLCWKKLWLYFNYYCFYREMGLWHGKAQVNENNFARKILAVLHTTLIVTKLRKRIKGKKMKKSFTFKLDCLQDSWAFFILCFWSLPKFLNFKESNLNKTYVLLSLKKLRCLTLMSYLLSGIFISRVFVNSNFNLY